MLAEAAVSPSPKQLSTLEGRPCTRQMPQVSHRSLAAAGGSCRRHPYKKETFDEASVLRFRVGYDASLVHEGATHLHRTQVPRSVPGREGQGTGWPTRSMSSGLEV